MVGSGWYPQHIRGFVRDYSFEDPHLMRHQTSELETILEKVWL